MAELKPGPLELPPGGVGEELCFGGAETGCDWEGCGAGGGGGAGCD